MLARFTGAGLLAALITFSLVFLMQLLIGRDRVILEPIEGITIKDIFWEGDPPPDVTRGRPEKPEKIEPVADPKPKPTGPTIEDRGDGMEQVFRPTPMPPGEPGDDRIAMANRGAYPIFRVPHRFPSRAQRSGCVTYGFTITKTGGTRDVHVIDSSSRLFEAKGVEAIEQYRYEPPILNGRPVEAPLQSIRLVWQLEGEALPDHPACQ